MSAERREGESERRRSETGDEPCWRRGDRDAGPGFDHSTEVAQLRHDFGHRNPRQRRGGGRAQADREQPSASWDRTERSENHAPILPQAPRGLRSAGERVSGRALRPLRPRRPLARLTDRLVRARAPPALRRRARPTCATPGEVRVGTTAELASVERPGPALPTWRSLTPQPIEPHPASMPAPAPRTAYGVAFRYRIAAPGPENYPPVITPTALHFFPGMQSALSMQALSTQTNAVGQVIPPQALGKHILLAQP